MNLRVSLPIFNLPRGQTCEVFQLEKEIRRVLEKKPRIFCATLIALLVVCTAGWPACSMVFNIPILHRGSSSPWGGGVMFSVMQRGHRLPSPHAGSCSPKLVRGTSHPKCFCTASCFEYLAHTEFGTMGAQDISEVICRWPTLYQFGYLVSQCLKKAFVLAKKVDATVSNQTQVLQSEYQHRNIQESSNQEELTKIEKPFTSSSSSEPCIQESLLSTQWDMSAHYVHFRVVLLV